MAKKLKVSEIVYSMYGCMGVNSVCHCSLKSYRLWALRRIYRRGGVVKCGGTRILQGSLTYDFTEYSWILIKKKYWIFLFCQKLVSGKFHLFPKLTYESGLNFYCNFVVILTFFGFFGSKVLRYIVWNASF